MGAIDGSNGMVWTWGVGGTGSLGDGTKQNRSSPVSILRSSSYMDFSMTGLHNLFLDGVDGSVWAVGYNNIGQLGNNDVTSYSSPVSVLMGVSCVWVGGVSGGSTSFALDYQGTVWMWGRSHLDIGSYKVSDGISSPISILTNVSRVYVGAYGIGSAAALMNDGSLCYWGREEYGQFGLNTAVNKNSPNIASVLSNSFVNIASSRSLILRDSAGMVWGMGQDIAGAIGNNTASSLFSIPVSIARSGSYAVIDGNIFVSGAIDGSDGTIWMWGIGSPGVLGNGTTGSVSSPVTIQRSASYKMFKIGGTSCVALDGSDGSVWTWGSNSSGQLGTNTTNNASSPVPIVRPGSYVFVSTSGNTCFAIDGSDGSIWGWGNNFSLLGDNTSPNRSSPVSLIRSSSYVYIANGTNGSGAIDGSNGMIWTWGAGVRGMLGNGTADTRYSSPVSILRSASYVKLAFGYGPISGDTVFAIDGSNGSLWAWGQNESGFLGDGTYEDRSSPVSVKLGKSCIDVWAGYYGNYAIDYEGIIWSWGKNVTYSLANGENYLVNTPTSFGKMIVR